MLQPVNEEVILVNEQDEVLGTAEKLYAHQQGLLHRAFSIFIFDNENRLLLQQRALQKYHSAGLWTNTCCSHPRPDESMEDALQRRLTEEMGFGCPLKKAFNHLYYVELENGLIEHELDHIYTGRWEGEPQVNPEEVAAWRWISPPDLRKELEADPERFTYWFKEIIDEVLSMI